MRIRIYQFERYGVVDTDKSIEITNENLCYEDHYANELSGDFSKIVFSEKIRNGSKILTFNGLSFPDIKGIYIIWIEELKRWVEVYILVKDIQLDLKNICDITLTDGPYKINTKEAEIIKKAYNMQVNIDEIYKTPPM